MSNNLQRKPPKIERQTFLTRLCKEFERTSYTIDKIASLIVKLVPSDTNYVLNFIPDEAQKIWYTKSSGEG
jgi:hypothetical protein